MVEAGRPQRDLQPPAQRLHADAARRRAARPQGAASADGTGAARGARRRGRFQLPAAACSAAARRRSHGGRRRVAAPAARARRSASSANPARASRPSAARCCGSMPSDGRDPVRRQGHRRMPTGRDAPAAARAADRLPGPVRLAVAAHDGRRHRRRGAAGPRARPVARRARPARRRRRWRRSASIPLTRNRYPHEFSGGQRQRIAIARAMILEAEAWSCWTSRPRRSTARCRARSSRCCASLQAEHGLAYLFISHDLAVVRAMADYDHGHEGRTHRRRRANGINLRGTSTGLYQGPDGGGARQDSGGGRIDAWTS